MTQAMTPSGKLCPFDKKPCIRDQCAVWVTDEDLCSFALTPPGIRRPGSQVRPKEKPVSSGISGRYRDPLFD